MFWDNRELATVEIDTGVKAPVLTENDANLFKGIAQEHTAMLARVRQEKKERERADGQLEEEMHSFGVIPADPASSAARFYYVEVNDTVSIPCRDAAGDVTHLAATLAGVLSLSRFGEDGESVKLSGAWYDVDGFTLAVVAHIQKSTGAGALYISLAGAAYIDNALYIPDGRTNLAVTADKLKAYA